MKTQILRLEAYDDYISARDKMGWNKAGRILLVWPERGRVLHRRLDLVLLQRHSRTLGAQLVLVSKDPQVNANARDLALPVFRNLSQAQRAHWRMDRRFRVQKRSEPEVEPRPRPDLQELRQSLKTPDSGWLQLLWVRLAVFSLGLVAILALAALIAPSATLELTPRVQSQSLEFEITARPDLQGITLSGALPVESIRVLVEGSGEVESSGTQRIADSFAAGEVQFTNLTTQTLTIPTGLVVRSLDTSPQRYITTRSGKIEPGPGSTLLLAIQALEAGSAGNQSAGRVKAIEGNLGTRLAVTNPRAISGGANRSVPAPTQQDRQRLYQQVEAELRRLALNDLQAGLGQGDLLLSETITLTQGIEQVYDPPVQQAANRLRLKLLLEYHAYKINGSSLTDLASAVLDANLPPGYASVPNSLEVVVLKPPPVGGDPDQAGSVLARRQMQARLSADTAVQFALGMQPAAAVERLRKGLELAEIPVIHLAPTWWPRLPLLPLRIGVIIHENPGR
jgi:hypothetical protein